MYHAALRVRVREVQQALRIDHDRLGAGEERGEMPEVQRLEGPAAARWFHGADVKEKLSVREAGCVECGVSGPDGSAQYLGVGVLVSTRAAEPRWSVRVSTTMTPV